MKINISVLSLGALFLVISSSCSTASVPEGVIQTSTSPSDSVRSSYNQAREKWESIGITDYNITVDVFSSLLPPPCQMSAILIINDNKLLSVQELVTPAPVQLPDRIILDPECSDYEAYTINNQLDFVENIVENKLPYEIVALDFNQNYGYVTHLAVKKSEAYKEVWFKDFKVK